LRLDANVFRRNFRNFADDDVLLDTGVSFPIAFNKARIFGEELRLAVAEWHRFSGFLSYSNQSAIAQGPTTGGLFLGSEAGDALTDTGKFAVTQDQRNTVRASVRAQIAKQAWVAANADYGSGLPVELDPTSIDMNFLLAQYGPEILSRINFDRGRVRPNFSLGAACGVELYRKESRSLNLQIEAANLTDRVNVLNFAGLFSGTALQFAFAERRWDIEPAFYVQDNFHQGNWNVSAGLRFDHYGFVASESALSPRVGVSRYIDRWKILCSPAPHKSSR